MLWDSLPVEIHTRILEALILHGESARYASVCRAWQTIIEQRIFARIKVSRSRLDGFSDIGYRHRHLVKCIWFSIEPSEYDCPQCGDALIYSWRQVSSKTNRKAFQDLVDQLSRWEPKCLHCGGVLVYNWRQVSSKSIRKAIQDLVIQLSRWEPSGSLLLDISVKALSRLMHSSSIMQYGPPVVSEPKKDKIIESSHRLHDTRFQDMAAYVFKKITNVREPKPEPSQKLPKARAVTSLLLRRQTRHHWKSEALEELLDLLPEIQEIHYEPWRDWRRMEERPTITSEARDTLDISFPPKLCSYNAAMQVT